VLPRVRPYGHACIGRRDVDRGRGGDGQSGHVNVRLVAPAGTVTLAGTVATVVSLLERETMAPAVGAGPLSVTLPVEGDPPLTLVGFSVSEVRVGRMEAAA